VHEKCPALSRHTCLPQNLNCIIEGVGHVVQIESIAPEQSLVNHSCDLRSILVVHEPAGSQFNIQNHLSNNLYSLPHGANDASEAAEKHRRCQMNCLVGCVPITLGSLASTQNGEHGIGKVQIHDILDCKIAILQDKPAPERIRVMDPMASKVKNVRRRALQQRA
jgi:hypothetical protein